jgi:hypothetical protein
LAELVAQARWPRRSIALALAPHREELLRLRREGASVEALAKGLRGLEVRVSDEALRLWLNRELGHKPPRRRRPRWQPNIAVPLLNAPTILPPPVPTPPPTASGVSAPAVVSPKVLSPGNTPLKIATSLIRAGETPVEAFARRNREREAEEAAAKATGTDTPAPRLARDVL